MSSATASPESFLAETAVRLVAGGVPVALGPHLGGRVVEPCRGDGWVLDAPVRLFRLRHEAGGRLVTLEVTGDDVGRVVEVALIDGHVSDTAPADLVATLRFAALVDEMEPLRLGRARRWLMDLQDSEEAEEAAADGDSSEAADHAMFKDLVSRFRAALLAAAADRVDGPSRN